MPQDDNSSEVNQSQNAAQNLTAGGNIQIGSIVQTIVNLGLPFNSQHLRFVQFLANSAYLICLIWGFVRLWQNGADFTTVLLLIVGSGLLSLTCLYYAWFWRPEVRYRSTSSSELSDSNELEKAQQIKARSRKRTRRLAIAGFFAIPLLTCAGFLGWRSLPPPKVLLLVANFDGVEQQNYQVTENILRNLRNATQSYADVKVQALNQTITEQQGSEVARAAGEQKKAAIVFWGNYGVTPTDVQISVHYELLKPPEYFPELGEEVDGKARTLAIAELNSFKLQTHLSNEMTYFTLFTLGMVQYAKKDWDGALVRFKAALDQVKEPVKTLGRETVYFFRGNSYLFKGDYQNAIADFDQALKLKPDITVSYNNRGGAYSNQGNNTQAIEDFTQAIKLQPNYAVAYYNRGSAYFDQGNLSQAIEDFTQAIKLQPDDAAYNNRGNAYAFQGNFTQAIEDFTQAIKLNPDNPDNVSAYTNRGNAYAYQGNFTQAIENFSQAIRLKPDYAVAYYNRGHAYFDQGNDTQAIDDFSQAIKLKPDYVEAYINRGIIYFNQGNDTQAIDDFSQAIKFKPDYVEAYNNRGNAYASQGNLSQAVEDLNQAIKLQPDLAVAYYSKARVYSLEGEVKAAIENLQQAINLDAKFQEMAKTDSDFDNIRKDKQFQSLVGE